MSDLYKFFDANESNLINKWEHYFDIYERYFQSYRNNPVKMLEIGINQGGSLKMWQHYFGSQAQIFAIDINPLCKKFESENIKIFIGSQDDPLFLKQVAEEAGFFDIIVDDGGHTMIQQLTSFDTLYPFIKEGGIYLCEDTHTSYWKRWGGGFRKSSSFIEFSKRIIDSMHVCFSEEKKFSKDKYFDKVYSIHFYNSIVVFEKKSLGQPVSRSTGKVIFPPEIFKELMPPVIENFHISKMVLKIKKRLYRFSKIGDIVFSKFTK